MLSAVALVVTACASTPPPLSPADVVEAQAAALRRGDGGGARGLLTDEARAVAAHWPERSVVEAPIDASERSRTARWIGNGEPLVVEREAGGWRIRVGVLGLMRADTPEEALSSFSLALSSRDYAALLRLVPDEERPGWTVERLQEVFEDPRSQPRWAALAAALRAAPIDLLWLDRARVRARVGEAQLVLVREPGGWKVFDVSPASEYTRP